MLAHWWLGEHLDILQRMGTGLLMVSLLLVGLNRFHHDQWHNSGWLAWLNPPQINPTEMTWQF